MTVQIATLCDSASDYGGKLCLMGAFDTLCAKSFPVVHPQCSLALRLVFLPEQAGAHQLKVSCIGPDGNECLPAFEPKLDVAFPSNFAPFVTKNLVLNLQRIQFERAGLYRWDLSDNGTVVATIPLRVTQFDPSRSATGPAG